MKLYVCWGTFKFAPRPGGHPCGNAYHALVDAGHRPEVVRAYGWAALPSAFNQTPARKEVKELTGNSWVPVLVADGGTVIQGSDKIIEWAKSHPAAVDTPAAAAG
jgi:Glutathione S-transferase, N-terminal domain